MALALGTGAVVLVVLLWELVRPAVATHITGARELWLQRRRRAGLPSGYDPGRERRAEQRARELLRSCVPEEDWEMYRDLGLLRVHGRRHQDNEGEGMPYAYLIYPHKPIVAYLTETGELLSEYCVAFPDETRPYGSARLPDSDDVLAKWMALTADERRLIGVSNMHLPGRQVEPERVRRDLKRIARWERERAFKGPAAPPAR
jgi:hypothetical protein